MIKSFKGGWAQTILGSRKVPKGFPADIAKVARRKLVMVNNAGVLNDLKSPPGNRLEALVGDLRGKHSIRIDDQWRMFFGGQQTVLGKSRLLTTTSRTDRDIHLDKGKFTHG